MLWKEQVQNIKINIDQEFYNYLDYIVLNSRPVWDIFLKINEEENENLHLISKNKIKILKKIIKKFGYDKSDDITKSDYRKIYIQLKEKVSPNTYIVR